jgi:hypothetical protein
MIVLSALRPDASLLEFLTHRARSASVLRLGADTVAGAAALAGALRWEPGGRLVIATAAICLACYGAWGLLDRARSGVARSRWSATARVFDALCGLCVGLGILSASGLLLAIWAIALGTWIS